jgi:hypothetical protein
MTDGDPHADLKRHALTPEQLWGRPVGVSRKTRKRREQFVMVPWTWVERLAKARFTATYRVTLHVLYRHWKGGGEPFTLSNGAVAMEGVGRRAKWRGLRELEQLGLITIERRKRKSPRIAVTVQNLNHET